MDVYEDGLCPICSQFEKQFGQQMAQAVDTGRITVNYHLLTFLDQQSASGDYSTRAGAAALCVAQEAGSTPGVFEKFHTALFAEGTQPKEGATTDLSNAQLAQVATDSGAGAAADCITSGSQIAAAQAANTSGQESLKAATGGQVGTPSVVRDGKPISTDVNWLTTLLANG
nr:thioredoxin domain-containing protein [Nakamurella flavida]